MRVSEEDDDQSGARWAADEPTAMWDESVMRDAGYEELAKHRAEKPRAESGPATERGVKGDVAKKIAVSSELTGSHAASPAKPASRAMSWVVTVVLAVGLAVVAYFTVRALR